MKILLRFKKAKSVVNRIRIEIGEKKNSQYAKYAAWDHIENLLYKTRK